PDHQTHAACAGAEWRGRDPNPDQEAAGAGRGRGAAQSPGSERQAAGCGKTGVGGRMEPFEYAIKKDVRNNPIVREVDNARQRELWKWAGVAAFLVVVLLFS